MHPQTESVGTSKYKFVHNLQNLTKSNKNYGIYPSYIYIANIIPDIIKTIASRKQNLENYFPPISAAFSVENFS